MHRYHFFDAAISSEIELPELPAADHDGQEPAFRIRVAAGPIPPFPKDDRTVHHWRSSLDNSITLSLARDDRRYLLEFPRLARFHIDRASRQVTGFPLSRAPEHTLRHLLLDQVLPRLFSHFLRYPVFHAAGVQLQSGCICLFGDTGWGKSTLAGAFRKSGATLLSDDCIRLTLESGRLSARPSYRSIRLLPDSLEALGYTGTESGTPAAHYSSKQRFLQATSTEERAVLAFFLLNHPNQCRERQEVEIQPVPGYEAVIELLKNSFCLDLQDQSFLKHQFARTAELAKGPVPTLQLCYSRSYDRLDDTVQSIRRYLEESGS